MKNISFYVLVYHVYVVCSLVLFRVYLRERICIIMFDFESQYLRTSSNVLYC